MAETLCARLGGADGIKRLVDDAVDGHLANPLVKARFESVVCTTYEAEGAHSRTDGMPR